MVDHAIPLGTTNVSTHSRLILDVVTEEVDPPGGLYPYHLKVFEVDDYLIYQGWPVERPKHIVTATTLVSAVGQIMTSRPPPDTVATNATVRWVADDVYYDQTRLTWDSLPDPLLFAFETSVAHAPTLINDYAYRIGNEKFLRQALNFDADDHEHMWLNLSQMPVEGYSVILVMSPNSVYGNDPDTPYAGIWGFGGNPDDFPESAERFMNVSLQGNHLWFESDAVPRVQALGIGDFINSNAPLYLGITLNRPQASLMASSGPGRVSSVSIPTGDLVGNLDPRVALGRTPNSVEQTADMAVFDISVYTEPLTQAEFANEVATLAQAYGGET